MAAKKVLSRRDAARKSVKRNAAAARANPVKIGRRPVVVKTRSGVRVLNPALAARRIAMQTSARKRIAAGGDL